MHFTYKKIMNNVTLNDTSIDVWVPNDRKLNFILGTVPGGNNLTTALAMKVFYIPYLSSK